MSDKAARRARIIRRVAALRAAAKLHPPKRSMPKGTYWDEHQGRYVAPGDDLWSLARYHDITEDTTATLADFKRPTEPAAPNPKVVKVIRKKPAAAKPKTTKKATKKSSKRKTTKKATKKR
jgi:hypothetical protein